MDFYERLRSLGNERYQNLVNALARIGDPQEIIAHIAAMPICCEEGKGIFHVDDEVRIDKRFLVICDRKKIWIYKADQVKMFFVSAVEGHHYSCRFNINDQHTFTVNGNYAAALYRRLDAVCPNSFQPDYSSTPMIAYGTEKTTVDERGVTTEVTRLFKKEKKITTVPLHSICACYQEYSSDPESSDCYLWLCLRDGRKERIRSTSDSDNYKLARQLKARLPDLEYRFILMEQ